MNECVWYSGEWDPVYVRMRHAQNSRDAVEKGRSLGRWPQHAVTKTRQRKITDDQVREIRASTEPLVVLAARYKTSQQNISLIRNRRRKKLVV